MSYKIDTAQARKQAETNPYNIDDAFYILAHSADFSAEVVQAAQQTERDHMGEEYGYLNV